MALNIKTQQVGLDESIQDVVNRINRRGLNVKIRSSDYTQPLGRITQKADEFTKSLEASNARVIAFGASAAIIGSVVTAFKELTVQSIKVEKILTDINVVLNTSLTNLQKFGNDLFKVARNTSQSLEVAAEAALEFSRQGLSMEETLKRTNDALILTRLTGIKAADAVSGLTAAVNGFADAGLTTTNIINKLAAVDVKFAVSADDLIDALARAGAVAQDAGVNFDQLVGAVTSAQQITARGGAVIGNSFKTIFTRIQRSSTLDRLEELGVAVRDIRGNTLPALSVLQSLSKAYDTLGSATKAAVAEQVGGVFQINVLKAALKDLNRENSLYAQATQISSQATDQAQQKNAQLQKTISSLATQTSLTIQELSKNLGDLALAPGISKVLDAVNSLAGGLNDLFGKDSEGIGADFAKGLVSGIGSVLTGPGLVLVFGVFAKLFTNALKFAKSSLKDVLGIVSAKDKEKAIQESIVMAMSQNKQLAVELNKYANDKTKQEQVMLEVIKQQTRYLQQQQRIAGTLAPGLVRKGVNPDLTLPPKKTAAEGYIPNFSVSQTEKMVEKNSALKAGYVPGNVKSMNIDGVGRVVYNGSESVKKFPGMKQEAIVPPFKSKAGKKYQSDFENKHGFDPYMFDGFIPNFIDPRSRAQKIKDTLNDPANKGIKFNYKNTQPQIIKSKNIWDQEILRMFQQNPNQQYLGAPLIDYLSNKGYNRNQLQNLAKNPSKFKIMSDGFVPNFALEAMASGNVLRLPKAKMFVQTSDNKYAKGGWHNIKSQVSQLQKDKGARQLSSQLMALEALGITTLTRPFYFTKSGDPLNKVARSASRKQRGLSGGDRSRIPGSIYEKGLQKNLGKKGYISTSGDPSANVDFVAPGRTPIEAKFNDAKANSIMAKSLKLTTDRYLENYLESKGMSPFAKSLSDTKKDLALKSAEKIWKEGGSSQVSGYNLSSGFIPNFRSKSQMKKNIKDGRAYETFVGQIFNRTPSYNAPIDFYGPVRASASHLKYISPSLSKKHISNKTLGYDFIDAHSGPGHTSAQLFKKFLNEGIIDQNDIDDYFGTGVTGETYKGKPIDLSSFFTEVNRSGNEGIARKTHKGIPFIYKKDVFGGKSSGFIPNFANPLEEAVDREEKAGIPRSQIRISRDSSLVSRGNPMGLGVINTRDEPGGIKQGINRAIRMGIDPKTHGASSGFIPNFKESDNMGMGKLFALTSLTYAVEGFVSQLSSLEEETSKTVKGIVGVTQGLSQAVLVGSSFKEIAQSGGKLGKVFGAIGPLGAIVAGAIPVFQAVKENTDWLDNSLDRLNKSAAKTSKGLDSLTTAISQAQDVESTRNEITELNNSASLNTFDGQLKKLELETKLAKQNTELSKSANSLSKNLNLSGEEVQLMTSGTTEGMKALQEAQLLYARKLNGIQVSKGLQRDESKRDFLDKTLDAGAVSASLGNLMIDIASGNANVFDMENSFPQFQKSLDAAGRLFEDSGVFDRTDASILRDPNSVKSARILAARSLGSSVSMNESAQGILDINPNLSGSKYLEGIKKNVEIALKSGDAGQEGAAVQIQQILEGIGDDPSLQKEGSEDLKAIYGLLKKYKSELEKDVATRKGDLEQSRKMAAIRAQMSTIIERQFQAEKNRLDIISAQQGLDSYTKDLDNQYKIKAGIVTKSNQVEMEMAAKRKASDERYANELANINNERIKALRSEISKFSGKTSNAFKADTFAIDPDTGKGLTGKEKIDAEDKAFLKQKQSIVKTLQNTGNADQNFTNQVLDAKEFDEVKIRITQWLQHLTSTGKAAETIASLQGEIFDENANVLQNLDNINTNSALSVAKSAQLKNIEDKKNDASEDEINMRLGTLGYVKKELNRIKNTPTNKLNDVISENLKISKGLSDIEYQNLKNRQIYTRDGQGLLELQEEQKSIAHTSVMKEYESLFITGQRLAAEEELRKKYGEYKGIIEQKVANEIKTMGFTAEDDTELLKQQRDQKYFSIKADTDYTLAVNAAARAQEEFNANLDNGRFLLDAKHEMAEAERDYTRTLVKLKAKLADNFFFEEGQRSVDMKKSTDQSEMQKLKGERSAYEQRGAGVRVAEKDLEIARKQKEINLELGKEALFRDTITERIKENNLALERFGETLANTTFDAVETGFQDLFKNITEGTMSMGDSIKSFAGGIAKAVGDALTARATKQITTGIMELFDFKNSGGLIKGYASGGTVGGSNKVPAMLTNGEYVVKKKIVDRLGINTFDNINKSGTLDDLYNQPNEDLFDLQTEGASQMPQITQMSSGGLLGQHLFTKDNTVDSGSAQYTDQGVMSPDQMHSLDQTISRFNGGVVSLLQHFRDGSTGGVQEKKSWVQEKWQATKSHFTSDEAKDAYQDIAEGGGYMLGKYLGSDKSNKNSKDNAPIAPEQYKKLNVSSALDIDPQSNMMSGRFKANDQYRKDYGQYLLDKYEYDIDQKNQKVLNRMNQLNSLATGFTSMIAAKGLGKQLDIMKDGMKGGMSNKEYRASMKNLPKGWEHKGFVNPPKTMNKEGGSSTAQKVGSKTIDISGSGAISGGGSQNKITTTSQEFANYQSKTYSRNFSSNMQDLYDNIYNSNEMNNGGVVSSTLSHFNRGGSVNSSVLNSNPYSYFNRGGSVNSSVLNSNPYSYFNRGGSVSSSVSHSNPYSYFNRGGSVNSSVLNSNPYSYFNRGGSVSSSVSHSNPYSYFNRGGSVNSSVLNSNPYSYFNRGGSVNSSVSHSNPYSYFNRGGSVNSSVSHSNPYSYFNRGGSVNSSVLNSNPYSYFNRGGSVSSSVSHSNPYSYFNRGGSVNSSVLNSNPYSYFNRGGSVNSSVSHSNPYSYFNRGGSVSSSVSHSNPYSYFNRGGSVNNSSWTVNPYSYFNRGGSVSYNNSSVNSHSMQYMSGGGKVKGPGGIDKVGPVMLDKGEYVIKASSVQNVEKKYPGFFNKLNSMKMNKGGVVQSNSDPISNISNDTNNSSNSSSNVTVNINVSSEGSAQVDGGNSNQKEFASKIKEAVVGIIAQEKRVGGMLRG